MSEHTIDPYQLAIKKPPKYEAPRTLDLKAGQEPGGKKIMRAIRAFKKNLTEAEYIKGTDKYNKLLAISLCNFALLPKKKGFLKIKLPKNVEEKLKTARLDKVVSYIKTRGGLGLINFKDDCDAEVSPLEALEKNCGRYTEEHKIILFIFKMAGLKKELLAEHYLNSGNNYLQKGHPDPATREYEKAIKINPDFAEAHCNLGVAYAKKGYFDQAIIACKKAIKINPDFAEAHCNLGDIYTRNNELDKAIKAYTKVIEINPDFAEAHYNLGGIYARNNEWDKAIKAYTKVTQINPNDGDAHYNLGMAYARLVEKETEKKTNNIQTIEMYCKKALNEFEIASKLGPIPPELQTLIERLKGKLPK